MGQVWQICSVIGGGWRCRRGGDPRLNGGTKPVRSTVRIRLQILLFEFVLHCSFVNRFRCWLEKLVVVTGVGGLILVHEVGSYGTLFCFPLSVHIWILLLRFFAYSVGSFSCLDSVWLKSIFGASLSSLAAVFFSLFGGCLGRYLVPFFCSARSPEFDFNRCSLSLAPCLYSTGHFGIWSVHWLLSRRLNSLLIAPFLEDSYWYKVCCCLTGVCSLIIVDLRGRPSSL